MAKLPYALQLYTVRDELEKNAAATLHKVKEMGYDYVELAGTAGLSAAEFKALLDEAGLTPISVHAGYERIAAGLDEVAAEAKHFGLEYVVVPWLGGEACPDKEAWLTAIRQMDAAGARLRSDGIQLCYHNHAHEFEQFEGVYIFDLIYENSAPEHLASELDTCWSEVGGADTVALMKKYGNRIPLLHVKDYERSQTGDVVFRELGQGCMVWEPIFQAAKACEVAWYIVEQDAHFAAGGSLESAAISASFMAARET